MIIKITLLVQIILFNKNKIISRKIKNIMKKLYLDNSLNKFKKTNQKIKNKILMKY